jgi:hypothetical protein
MTETVISAAVEEEVNSPAKTVSMVLQLEQE